jgi:penicillin-binding protein 1C
MVGLPTALTTALLLLPWPALDAARDERPGARITDRTGVLLAVMPGRDGAFQLREGPVGSPGGIPAACAELFIQLEDKRFRQHPGIDPLAFARALGQRVLGQATQSGASTITMQLARIVAPHPRSVPGKAREALEAVRLEARLTKDEILDLYLNEVPFGRNARGVGAAAWTYFGADLETLDAAQFLVLAIIPRNPTVYDPFLHPAALEEAAIQIDDRLGLGIPAAEIRAAVKGARTDRPQGAAPHFARYVAGLVADGGMSPSRGVVRTTLDAALNAGIEARVQFVLERYARARVTNAAVVVLDNTTGAVVGWVGSRDFNDTATSGQIDGVLIRRQSASTLKPFLYADALQAGWTAATLLPDVPMVFGSADEEAYRPQNFDNRSHGVVRVRTALASSLNVPAVYTLSHVGVDTFFGTLGALGFHLPTDAAGRWGLGAAVGNVEVTLLDLAHGFTVFPRGGTVIPVSVTAAPASTPRRVFDTFTAWLITDILSDPSARATGFGIHTFFRTDFPALFKSGTSSEFTNLWCVGATPRFTVAAWAGNFDGRAVINKTGSIVPAQIVTDVLTAVTATVPGAARLDFVRPASAVAAVICTSTGAAAGAGCGPTRTEYFRNTREVPRAGAGGGSVARTGGDALLQDQFLDGTHPVRILFPVSGQVFYRDTTVRAVGQGLPVLIAARQGTRPTVTYDGRVIPAGSNPSEIILPLTRGMHTITVSSPEGSDRSRFEVR